MIRLPAWMRTAGLCAALALVVTAPASAVTITEFPAEAGAPAGTHRPFWITSAPDGTLWYTSDGTTNSVRHITTNGEALTPVSQTNYAPYDLGFDAAGNLYWVKNLEGNTGGGRERMDPAGGISSSSQGGATSPSFYAVGFTADSKFRWTEQLPDNSNRGAVCRADGPDGFFDQIHCTPTPGATPPGRITGLALDADGRMWAVMPEVNRVLRLSEDENSFDKAVELPAGSLPTRAVLGPDGNLWVVAFGADRVYRIDTHTGDASKFFQLPAGRGPNAIALGPDGAVWFTELSSNSIGRLTAALQYNSYPVPTPASKPYALTTGADGNIWFTEYDGGKVARLVPDTGGGGGRGGGGGGGSGTDSFAPRFLRGLAFVPSRFRRSSQSLAVNAVTRRFTAPVGSSMRFTLSEAAKVTIAIDRRTSGRRVNGKCVAPTRARRLKPRCTRYVRARTLTRNALQGPNHIAFSGRVGGRKLALGTYRATAVAVDAARNRSAPSRAGFTLVAR